MEKGITWKEALWAAIGIPEHLRNITPEEIGTEASKRILNLISSDKNIFLVTGRRTPSKDKLVVAVLYALAKKMNLPQSPQDIAYITPSVMYYTFVNSRIAVFMNIDLSLENWVGKTKELLYNFAHKKRYIIIDCTSVSLLSDSLGEDLKAYLKSMWKELRLVDI